MLPPDLAGSAAELAAFLQPWDFLWGSVVVELFEKELWRALDANWSLALKDVHLEELLKIPMGQHSTAWPESLQWFVSRGRQLSIPRNPPRETVTSLHGLLAQAGYASNTRHLSEHLDIHQRDQAAGPQPGPSGSLPRCIPNGHTDAGSGVAVKAVPMFLLQGMSSKKQHEVLELAHLIANLAQAVDATHVIDVGAGQGSLAQVLALAYGLPIIAVETSEHNNKMASRRASKAKRVVHKRGGLDTTVGSRQVGEHPERASRMALASDSTPTKQGQESQAADSRNASHPGRNLETEETSTNWEAIKEPKTVTATISMENVTGVLSALVDSHFPLPRTDVSPDTNGHGVWGMQGPPGEHTEIQNEGAVPAETRQPWNPSAVGTSDAQDRQRPRVILVGLHACGDLSPAILRAFTEWQDVVAVVSLGCCYNMLTELPQSSVQSRSPPRGEAGQEDSHACECISNGVRGSAEEVGFPMSEFVRSLGLVLGHSGRDLALQSADRWCTTAPALALENFQAHTFRAALPLVVRRQFPNFSTERLRVGHLGKAARRKKLASLRTNALHAEEEQHCAGLDSYGSNNVRTEDEQPSNEGSRSFYKGAAVHDPSQTGQAHDRDRLAFQEYVKFAMQRLGLPDADPALVEEVWAHVSPIAHLVPSFYMLRAVLAPVLESLIIIDRLLFLQEKGCTVLSSASQPFPTGGFQRGQPAQTKGELTATAFPIFKPEISPRNIAIIALRNRKSLGM